MFRAPDLNLALICGQVSGGLAVLDIDDPKLADAIGADGGLQAETTMVRTPRGGLHVYAIETDAASRSGPLVPGVADFKGEGGYVLAPPSSIDGREYLTLANTTIMCVPDARAWAVDILGAFDVDVPERPEREPLDVADALEGVTEGERDETLFRLACRLRRADVPRDMADRLVTEAAAACVPPFPKRDALAKVASAYSRYEPSSDEPSGALGPVVVTLNTVEREEVDWLWCGRLARGKPTCLMGDPGVGKSFVTAAIGTAVSVGAALPGETETREPADVLYLACDDGLADTMRPRFEDMHADLTKIHVLTAVRGLNGKERHPSLVDDLPDIERALVEHHCKLLIIDPINNYLGSQLDTHKDAALRGALAPLSSLCERLGIACIFVIHLTKSARDKPIYRAQGSIAYIGLSRVALLAGANAENPDDRAVVWMKGNNSEPMPSIGYEIVAGGKFRWIPGESSLTAKQILAPDSEATSKIEEAEAFLADMLADGPMAGRELMAEAKAALGISQRTVKDAKAHLGVRSIKIGFGKEGEWLWCLDNVKGAKDARMGKPALLDESAPEKDTAEQEPCTLSERCGLCDSAEIKGRTPEGKPRCPAHFVKETDSEMVRAVVEQLGLPIVARRKAERP